MEESNEIRLDVPEEFAKIERPDKERSGMSADVIELDGRVVYRSPVALNPDKHYIIAGGKMPEVPEHFKGEGFVTVSDAQACLPGQPMRDNTQQYNTLSEQARVEYEARTKGTMPASLLGMAMGGAMGAIAGGCYNKGGIAPLSDTFGELIASGIHRHTITDYICERESSRAWKRRMKKERQRIIHRDRVHRELMHRFKRLMEEESLPGMKLMFGKFDPAIPGNPNTPAGLAFTSRYGVIDDLDRTTGRLWMEFVKGVLLSE